MCEVSDFLLQILLKFRIKCEFFEKKMNFLKKLLAKPNRMYYTTVSAKNEYDLEEES